MDFSTLADVIESHKSDDLKGITFIKQKADDHFLSYKDLHQTSLRVLHNLQISGVKPKDELVFQVYDNEQFVLLFWACILGNIIPVPLTFATKDDARDKIFNIWPNLNNPYMAIDRQSIAQFGGKYNDKLDSIKKNILYLEDLLDLTTEGRIVKSTPDEIAFIQFSSGSTGAPKGVVLTHRNVLTNTNVVLQTGNFSARETWLSWMPLTHDMGLIGFHIMPTTAGGMQYSMTPTHFIADPIGWMRRANEHRASVLCSPNFGYKYFLDHYHPHKAAGWDLSCVRLIFNGAEPISAELCNTFLDKMSVHGLARNSMFTVYGLAEATLAVSFPPVGEEFRSLMLDRNAMRFGQPVQIVDQHHSEAVRVINVGCALKGSPIRIVDNHNSVLGESIIGNIQIKGNNVTGGYYNNPSKTREMITVDGWLATEDLGFLLDGNLFVTGRAKDIIFVNGVNYYSHDIEAVAEAVSGVGFGRAIAIGMRNKINSEDDIILFIKVKDDNLEKFAALKALVKEAVSKKIGVVVRHCVPVGAIPRTTSGKPQRFRLSDAFNNNEYDDILEKIEQIEKKRVSDLIAPVTLTEKRIAKIWSEVLNIDISTINSSSGFLELGGDSLNAIESITRIQNELGLPATITVLFENSRLNAFAEHLDHAVAQGQGMLSLVLSADNDHPSIVAQPENKHLPFPLTEVQQAYWLGRSDVFDLGNVSTHYYLEVDICDLNIDALNRAVQKTISRHDMLKAVVLPDGTQQILEFVPPYEIELEDLSLAGFSQKRLERIRFDMSHEVLPLDAWPHFKIKASRLPGGRTRIHLSIDLVCIDGWSIRIFLNDIIEFYKNPDWAPLSPTISFRDYIAAFTRSCVTPRYQLSERYWRARLANLPAAPELPTVCRPNTIKHPRFTRLQAKLERPAWDRLKKKAIQRGLTPTSVLLSAFAEVLSNWSKKKTFTINVTLFNRPNIHKDINLIIGDFTSSILLEVDCTDNLTFADRSTRVLHRLANDLEHRHVSGVTVIREMARKQGQAPNALMPVVFTSTLGYQVDGDNFTRLSEIGETVYAISQTPQVWLDHQIYEENGELVYNWDYVEDLFPVDLIPQMFTVYSDMLANLSLGEKLWDNVHNDFIGRGYSLQRKAANADEAPISDSCLHTLFIERARQNPHKTAIVTPDGSLSYQDVLDHSKNIGSYLRRRGVTKNSFVAVAMDKGWEQVVGVLGILFSGAAYLPIDPKLPEERIHYLLTSAETKIVLTKSCCINLFNIPESAECIAIESIICNPDVQEEIDFNPHDIGQGIDDLAYMIFTSGSTGVPKGVMIDHRGAVNTILDINERFNISEADRVLALSNLNFDLSVYDIFGTFAAGGTIVIPDASQVLDPEHWATLLVANSVSVWNSVPALMQLLVDYAENYDPEVLRPLKRVLLSGDWIPVELPERIKKLANKAKVISLGGATEASIWSIFYPIETIQEDIISIPYGKPLCNQKIYVLDEQLCERPDWVPGELYIGGIGLANGYWKDEAKTRSHFIIHPVTGERLYRTGDWGRYLPDGNIEFLGREDLQVKLNGYRIELGEIESILEKHVHVSKAVVEVSGLKKNLLTAYVVRKNNKDNSLMETAKVLSKNSNAFEHDLRSYLESKLPEYMIPNKYVMLSKIPLSSNGKVDRGALKDFFPTLEIKRDFLEPTSSVEISIAQLWRQLLNLEKIGLKDNFFDLGGDSVLAIQLHLNLKKMFKQDIPMAMLFKHTSIASMAAYLSSDRNVLRQKGEPDFKKTVAIHQENMNQRAQRRELRRRRS